VSVPLQPDYDLFTPPPEAPSGPPTDVGKFLSHHSRGIRYAQWKGTEAGWRVWRYVECTALDLAARGEQRISVKYLVEQARRGLDKPKVEINNSYTALLADDLVARHPHLVDLLERRKRRTP
jgi:hypothetical protein